MLRGNSRLHAGLRQEDPGSSPALPLTARDSGQVAQHPGTSLASSQTRITSLPQFREACSRHDTRCKIGPTCLKTVMLKGQLYSCVVKLHIIKTHSTFYPTAAQNQHLPPAAL